MKNYIYSGCIKVMVLFAMYFLAYPMSGNAQWSAPQTLYQQTASPEPGPFWVSPVIASEKDPSGAIHLVWTNKLTDEINVLAHASYANGIWSNMEVLPSAANSSTMVPTLAITPDGMLHVAYTALMNDESWVIMYTSKPAGGQWSVPAVVSGTEFLFNAYPQIFCDAQQMPHVIYIAFSNDGESTFFKHVKFSVANPSQTEVMPVPGNSLNAFNHRIAKSEDGTINCFWYSEGSNIEYASYNGSIWSATTTLATNANIMDESSVIPVATPSGELYAMWFSMEQEAGMYKHFTPGQGWGMLQEINDGAFVMGEGISDSENKVHVAGNLNDYWNEVYDLKYHFLSGGQWTHELILQSTPDVLPSFPTLEIIGDTLYCFYARVFAEGGAELAVSWKILDYLTPAINLPVNKEIALKVSPNPLQSSSVITFTAKNRGEIRFILTDALGRSEYATMQVQEEGMNSINFQSIFKTRRQKGVYTLMIITPWGRDVVNLVR